MDARLALLLHVPLGLKLSPLDNLKLFSRELDGLWPAQLVEQLVSAEARSYFLSRPDWQRESTAIFEKSTSQGVCWLHKGHGDYPAPWRLLSEGPLVFSYLGEPCWLTRPLLAVVGSRTPTSDSLLWMQRELLPFLRESGVGVVSGGARGIDQWSHRLSIDAGQPTVCVLPSGLLDPYPLSGESLWRGILRTGGCLLSTFSLQQPMRKHFFHIRNRWIAGLGDLCFVVEANRRSGSLLTATLANQENKDVCTLPVSPMAAQGLGNLELLMNGALMIRDRLDLQTVWSQASLSTCHSVPVATEGVESNS